MAQTAMNYKEVGLELWKEEIIFSFSMSLGEGRNLNFPCTHVLISRLHLCQMYRCVGWLRTQLFSIL